MQSRAVRAFAFALLSGLAACAGYPGGDMRAGTTTEAAVRASMGPPRMEFAEAGGGRALVYPHGPIGESTYIAHIGADGVLRSVEQVLDDDHFRALDVGMTRDDIVRRIGPPGEAQQFPTGKSTWLYRYVDTWGYSSEFSIDFDREGRAVNMVSVRLSVGGDRRR